MRLEADSERIQVREKTRRMSNGCNSVNALPLKMLGADDVLGIQKIAKFPALEPHADRFFFPVDPSRRPVYDDRVDFSQARNRFAQRPCGQHEAITESACAIDERDLDVTLQTVVLKSVITHDHVAVRICAEQSARCGDAVGPAPDGTGAALSQE